MKKYNVILYIITALAVALNIVMVTILPDTVALHWGIDGKPDAYGSKYVYLLYAAIPLLAAIVLPLIKMKDKDEKQKAVYMKTLIFIQVLFIAIFGVCY